MNKDLKNIEELEKMNEFDLFRNDIKKEKTIPQTNNKPQFNNNFNINKPKKNKPIKKIQLIYGTIIIILV